MDQADIDANKGIAAIGYIGILCLIPLLAKKDSPYAQFHGKQGLVLFIFDIIVGIIWVIPVIGWIAGTVGYIFGFVLFIMGLINALGGKAQKLPLIGQFGDKINF